MSKPIIAGRDQAVVGPTDLSRSVRWVLAGLALCTLLSSLGTSIVNIALPTLAEAFTASFQEVQWIVLAYLLASTALFVSVGRLGDLRGAGNCCWPESSYSPEPPSSAASRPRCGC